MTWQRMAILICGPTVIVTTAYLASRRGNASESGSYVPDHEIVGAWRATAPESSVGGGNSLAERCRFLGTEIGKKLDSHHSVLVRPPFVLAGNYSREFLDQLHRETILPTVRALSISYFDQVPREPITLLVFSDAEATQRASLTFDGRRRGTYSGYYLRDKRRAVIDLSSGDGTLVHELTHALGHVDFPGMPEWLDEGLASLHEQARFSQDGTAMVGQSNWRLHYLMAAARRNQIPSLERLASRPLSRDESASLAYAQSRYLCLYLQQKGLLAPYYRKLRQNITNDPTGLRTLLELLEFNEPVEFDRLFRQWILSLPKPDRPTQPPRESRSLREPRFACFPPDRRRTAE